MKDQPKQSRINLALLIDDEVIDQKMYMRIIKRSGMVAEVKGFLAADHALDYLQSNPHQTVDAIFLDINMPRMDGFEFLEAATATLGPRFAKVCIVMLTTSLDPSDYEKAGTFDVVKDFIDKPLTIDDVHHVAELVRQTSADGG